MTTSNGIQWSSRLTFVLASVGCAVGLGNIWLFPYLAGSNGGGAFVLVYLCAVVLLALPVLLAELMIGRRGAAGPPAAIAAVARESGQSERLRWVGIVLGGAGAIMSLAFYGVAGGWAMAYSVKLLSGQLSGVDAAGAQEAFNTLNGSPASLLPWFAAFLAVTTLISMRGVQAGVERAVRTMMPALFVILVVMVVYAAVMGDFARAASFLFKPDFSRLDSGVVLAAFGAAFFSVSVGITNMMAYGAYIAPETKLPSTSAIIVAADTLVALLAGFMIFPLLFSYGLQPGGGPGLVFITLPIAFAQIPGGIVFGTLFFVLLLFAALTSSIGMLEAPVSWLRDATKLSRRSAALLAGGTAFVLGIFAALSFNILADFHPLGAVPMFADKTVFDTLLHIVLNILMPVGGIFITLFAGWMVQRKFSRAEISGGEETAIYKVWLFLVRFVAPVLLALVLIDVASNG